jgi:phage shock protein E
MPPQSSLLSSPNLLILDVRSASEFSSGHYPSAVHLPVGEVAARGKAVVGADASRPVLTYCAAGVRAAAAAGELKKLGYSNVISCANYKEAEAMIKR